MRLGKHMFREKFNRNAVGLLGPGVPLAARIVRHQQIESPR